MDPFMGCPNMDGFMGHIWHPNALKLHNKTFRDGLLLSHIHLESLQFQVCPCVTSVACKDRLTESCSSRGVGTNFANSHATKIRIRFACAASRDSWICSKRL